MTGGAWPYGGSMTQPPAEVRRHYEDEIVEADRLTRGAGQLELVRTQELIRDWIPPQGLRILDVGGAAGIHAAWLADDGHVVHVIDPVERHVEQPRQLASESRSITAEVGDARRLLQPTTAQMSCFCSARSTTSQTETIGSWLSQRRLVSFGPADCCSWRRSHGSRPSSTG